MPIYKYRALNEKRNIVRGLVEANTVEAVAELLSERKLTIIALQETKSSKAGISLPFLKKVRHKSVVIFSRQLAVMIAATVPIVQSLRILVTQTEDAKLKDVVQAMADDVDGGMKMSSAFAKHPEAFSHFYVAMLRSGETSGRLEKVLSYLADQMEKDYDLISRVRGAMIYPAFILFTMFGVGVTMMIFVVPSLTSLLTETGAKLPFSTRMLIGASNFLVGYWWLLIIIVVGAIAGFQFFLRTPFGRAWWDTTKLKFPIFGLLVKKIILTRFTRSLSTLIRGGVPISRALKITTEVVSNEAFRVIVDQTVKEVEDGNSITTVFAKSKLVPTMVPQMMSVGERTGRMDEVLDRLGDFYARDVDNVVSSLTSLIEPLIMIILGLAVGFMVSAILLPIFAAANAVN